MQVLGSRLRLQLPQQLPSEGQVKLKVSYSTSPDSTALQFLAPSQTAGGKHPYLFTQVRPRFHPALVLL